MKKSLRISLVLSALCTPGFVKAVIIGNTVGYLLDRKEPYYTVRVGGALFSASLLSHQAEFEVGYTRVSDLNMKTEVMPVTVNYRAQIAAEQVLGGYIGAGAGMARISVSAFGAEADSWSAAGQGFAGLTLRLFENVSVDAGARYIWVKNQEYLGRAREGHDDTSIEIGAHIAF